MTAIVGFPPILTAAETAASDSYTINNDKVPGEGLMERAGRACFEEILKRKPNSKSFLVLCGKGNNGGDGFIIARLLKEHGLSVQAALFADVLQGDAEAAKNTFLKTGGEIISTDEAQKKITEADVLVDALYGVRFKGKLGPLESKCVSVAKEERERRGLFVAAVDIPSGVICDTGQVEGESFNCDLTVTFQALKPAHVCSPGAEFSGETIVRDIGVNLESISPKTFYLTKSGISSLAKKYLTINEAGHKGTRGHVFVAAGSPGHSGAAVLTCRAALRAGAGLVTLISDPETCRVAVANTPEIMTHEISEFGVAEKQAIKDLLGEKLRRGSIIVGPGLTNGWASGLLNCLFHESGDRGVPVVIDASAIELIGKEKINLPPLCILTPHPGELAKFKELTIVEVQADRFTIARQVSRALSQPILLKGAYSIIALPQGEIFVSPFANANLGTAGSGDTLSGLLGGVLARGVPIDVAALCVVFLHGLVGASIAPSGVVGSLASEFADHFPQALSELLNERN